MQNHSNLIIFPVLRWRFFEFAEDVEEWYQGLSEEGKDIFEDILSINSEAELPIHWVACEMLDGKCAEFGIWEWKFKADKAQQRLLGVFGKTRKTAVFLIGCTHKQKIYKPPDCLTTAVKRAKSMESGKGVPLRERKIRENL